MGGENCNEKFYNNLCSDGNPNYIHSHTAKSQLTSRSTAQGAERIAATKSVEVAFSVPLNTVEGG